MILSDIAAATGPGLRGVRTRFLGLTALSTALQAILVVALVPVFDALFGPDPTGALPWVAVQAVVFALAWLLDGAAMRAGLELGLALMRELGDAGTARIRTLDPDELHGEEATGLRSLIASGSGELTSMPVLVLGPLIQSVSGVPMLGVALCLVDWRLGLTALAAGVLLLLALAASRAMRARSDAEYERADAEVDERALEFGWAQPTLRAAGRGIDTVLPSLRAARAGGLRALLWQLPGDLVFTVVLQLSLVAFIAVTAVLYTGGELSGAEAAALVVVLMRIVESAGSLQLLSSPLSRAAAALPRIRELVRLRDSGATPGTAVTTTGSSPAPSIDLEEIGYRYPDGTTGLAGVTARIPAGGLTAVVGTSGSGKSTLVEIVAGLREPATGVVRVDDGAPGAVERLRGSSVVFQDTLLRRGTIRENIVAGGDLPAERLEEIAARAGLGPVLEGLEGGWDGSVGEGGRTLSGGERQRLGLARALAKPAGLLVLDEATSALDPGTERTVVAAVSALRGERTVLAVTHRPAMVAAADHVLVLEGGRVVESGTREELLAADGRFARLWRRWQETESWVLA